MKKGKDGFYCKYIKRLLDVAHREGRVKTRLKCGADTSLFERGLYLPRDN